MGKNRIDLSKTYEGKVTYITEVVSDWNNRRDTSIFENFLLVLEDGEFRRYAAGDTGCKGDFFFTDEIFTAETEECACMCDCNPLVDCVGDIILGVYDVIEFSEGKLILKSFFKNDLGGAFGTYTVEKLVELDRQ